jgi:hypothetical protein
MRSLSHERPTSAVVRRSLVLAGVLAALAGCQHSNPSRELHPDAMHFAEIDRALVQMLNRSPIDQAILSQHTIYPYHFVRHSPELNELGRRDLAVLLTHYREFPGPVQPLNVRRGTESDNLYDARIQRIAKAITDSGINSGRISIEDDMPGGDGAASDRVIRIMAVEAKAEEGQRRRLNTGGSVRGQTSGGSGGLQ